MGCMQFYEAHFYIDNPCTTNYLAHMFIKYSTYLALD